MLDGPGANSQTDKFKYATLLEALLITYTLDTIFITVKFHSRCDIMIQDYEASIDPIFKLDIIN